LWSVGRLM